MFSWTEGVQSASLACVTCVLLIAPSLDEEQSCLHTHTHTNAVEKEFGVIFSHPPHLFHSVPHPNSYRRTCMIYAIRTMTRSLLYPPLHHLLEK